MTTSLLALGRTPTAEGRYAAVMVSMEVGAAFPDDIGAAQNAVLDALEEPRSGVASRGAASSAVARREDGRQRRRPRAVRQIAISSVNSIAPGAEPGADFRRAETTCDGALDDAAALRRVAAGTWSVCVSSRETAASRRYTLSIPVLPPAPLRRAVRAAFW